MACNTSGNWGALTLKFWSTNTASSSCFSSVESVSLPRCWPSITTYTLNFDCIIIEMLQALGLLHVYIESCSVGLVCHSRRTQENTRRKWKPAGRRSRNASTLKVNLSMQLTSSTVILAVVRSSLKTHQSEDKVPYFHWPFLYILWPAHAVYAWFASKSCETAALLLVPYSIQFIISLSGNSWFQKLVTQMPFLLAKAAHIHNWKEGTVWILSCISATTVRFINNNNRDWAGGLKVRGSLLERALIRRIKMKCCGVAWCYNWPVQLHFVCLMVMQFIFTGTLWES